ncbi:MAG: hypothetical protein HY347_01350 [candidate division NC10 bacterium]|nr:hypothetical protein [candidate division NC10 bacterium]
MTTSDLFAFARIFFLPLILVFLIAEGGSFSVPAAVLFLLAVVADRLDGLLLSRGSRPLEKLLGPLAGKLLIASALIALVQVGRAPGWMVVLIVGKEFLVIGLQAISTSQGVALPRVTFEQIESPLELLAGGLLILDPWLEAVFPFPPGLVSLSIAMGIVLISGVEAFWGFWRMIDLDR